MGLTFLEGAPPSRRPIHVARWISCIGLLLLGCDGPTVGLEAPEVPLAPPPTPAGAGVAFVLDQIGVADTGFEANPCPLDDCTDELVAEYVERFFGGPLEPTLHDGKMLVLFELAYLDETYAGDDEHVALRLYRGRDVDGRDDNDFAVPPGGTDCCTFRLDEASLDPDAPTRAMYELSARIEDGLLATVRPRRVAIPWSPSVDARRQTLRLEGARARLRLADDLSTIEAGLLGGVVTFSALADLDNPYCKTISPRCPNPDQSMLDQFATGGRPADVDRDGDGFECVLDLDADGRADTCCEGAGAGEPGCVLRACRGAIVPPLDPGSPSSCVKQPEMVDGYDVTIAYTGVPATIQRFP